MGVNCELALGWAMCRRTFPVRIACPCGSFTDVVSSDLEEEKCLPAGPLCPVALCNEAARRRLVVNTN